MNHQPIHVKATFVSLKAGSTPNAHIELPVDISDLIDNITCMDYEWLNIRLGVIVGDSEHNMFFHKGSRHKYRLGKSAL